MTKMAIPTLAGGQNISQLSVGSKSPDNARTAVRNKKTRAMTPYDASVPKPNARDAEYLRATTKATAGDIRPARNARIARLE